MKKIILFCTALFFANNILTAQNINEIAPPPPSDTVSKVFSRVEFEAEFPGGRTAWIAYLQKNLKANVPVKNGAPGGRYNVIVRFIVSKDGSISDISSETNHGYGMEEEVIWVIRKGPKWIPASQDGKAVNAYRRQPITFLVTDK